MRENPTIEWDTGTKLQSQQKSLFERKKGWQWKSLISDTKGKSIKWIQEDIGNAGVMISK